MGLHMLAPEKTSSESGQKTWSHNVEDAFSKLSEGSAETLKLLQSLASKRPHLDLIAELKTMADLAKVQMDDIWGKLENANFMTAQQRHEQKSTLAKLSQEVTDGNKGQITLNADQKEIKQLVQETRRQVFGTYGLEAIFQHVSTATKATQGLAQRFPTALATELGEVKTGLAQPHEKVDTLAVRPNRMS